MTPAAERIWGLVCGFPGDRASKRELLVLKAYIDGSGTGAKDVLVLAGYIATVEQWAAFSTDWNRLLNMGPHPLRYFKMKELKNSPEKCVPYYDVIEQHVTAAVSCMIKTSDLVEVARNFQWPFKFDREGTRAFENPYYFGFKAIMDKFAANQSQLGITEPVDFIFDEETEKKRTLSGWDRIKYSATGDVAALLGDTPIYRDDEKTLPLQSADLFAYWVRQWELQGIPDALATLPFPWEKQRDIPRMEIRFEKDDFLKEFQRWRDDPTILQRALMSDEEISQALQERKESER